MMRKKSISFVFWIALAICTLFVLYGAFCPNNWKQEPKTLLHL